MDYLELVLQFEKINDSRYRIDAISQGQSKHSEMEISDGFIVDHKERLYRVERGTVEPGASYQELKALGGELFDKVFVGNVKELLKQCQQKANDDRSGLRIVVDLLPEAVKLSSLGWEYLCDPDHEFLVTWRKFSLAHRTTLNHRRDAIIVKLPLHILVVISKPPQSRFSPIGVEKEWSNLEASLASLKESGIVCLERVRANVEELSAYLLSHPEVNILHFIGHGRQGGLNFENDEGWDNGIASDKFADLVKNQTELGLVLLNSCSGAEADEYDIFSGTAQELLKKKIPAVIAMRAPISDTSAKVFSQSFYAALAAGFPVDAAISDARVQVLIRTRESEWGIPKLFMQNPGEQVFKFDAAVDQIQNEWDHLWNKYVSVKAAKQKIPDELFELISVFYRLESVATLADKPNLVQSARNRIRKIEPDLWAAASGLVREQLYERAIFLLDAVDHVSDNPQARSLVLRTKQFLKGIATAEQSVDTALKLWAKLGEKVLSLCVAMLLFGIKQGGETILQDKDLPRSLLVDQELRQIDEIERIIATSTNYQWPKPAGEVIKERRDLKKWLKQRKFENNPFGQRAIEKDQLLINTWVPPEKWDELMSQSSHLVVSDRRQDRIAVAFMLPQHIFTHQKKIFPVKIVLPVENFGTGDKHLRILDGVAHAVARTWIEFLQLNFIAFLDLRENEQRNLMALLLWHTKDREVLLGYFKAQRSNQEVWNKFNLIMIEGYEIYEQVFNDNEKNILALRPINTNSTFFITDCKRCARSNDGLEQIRILIQLAQELVDKQNYLKLFSDKDLLDQEILSLPRIDLRWLDESLSKMLSDRIYQASGSFTHLDGLFGLSVGSQKTWHDRLARESDGSLSKMLDLGNELLDLHLRYHPLDPDFWYDDLDAIFSRY